MTELKDDQIRDLILERFPRTFAFGPAGEDIVEHEETRGPKSAFWHTLAIEYVKSREAEGISRNEACREFQKRLASEFSLNLAAETIMDVVRSKYGRPYKNVANKKFVFAVFNGFFK